MAHHLVEAREQLHFVTLGNVTLHESLLETALERGMFTHELLIEDPSVLFLLRFKSFCEALTEGVLTFADIQALMIELRPQFAIPTSARLWSGEQAIYIRELHRPSLLETIHLGIIGWLTKITARGYGPQLLRLMLGAEVIATIRAGLLTWEEILSLGRADSVAVAALYGSQAVIRALLTFPGAAIM
jgi:hypothetical protein